MGKLQKYDPSLNSMFCIETPLIKTNIAPGTPYWLHMIPPETLFCPISPQPLVLEENLRSWTALKIQFFTWEHLWLELIVPLGPPTAYI